LSDQFIFLMQVFLFLLIISASATAQNINQLWKEDINAMAGIRLEIGAIPNASIGNMQFGRGYSICFQGEGNIAKRYSVSAIFNANFNSNIRQTTPLQFHKNPEFINKFYFGNFQIGSAVRRYMALGKGFYFNQFLGSGLQHALFFNEKPTYKSTTDSFYNNVGITTIYMNTGLELRKAIKHKLGLNLTCQYVISPLDLFSKKIEGNNRLSYFVISIGVCKGIW
jgi:hypothetical protein